MTSWTFAGNRTGIIKSANSSFVRGRRRRLLHWMIIADDGENAAVP